MNMDNKYKSPKAEIILLDKEDTIRTSQGGTETSIQDNDNGNWNLNDN
jgi:hypothetical protein